MAAERRVAVVTGAASGVGAATASTGDELDPDALPIRTLVNGEIRQESNTSNLIFDCFDQVELLSAVCTLEPGDVVATGTPSGVGMASDRYLVPDDRDFFAVYSRSEG